MSDARPAWTFLTNHAHVLLCLSRDPEVLMRDIAGMVGITERAVQRIIADLEDAGHVVRVRRGRRNQYEVRADLPLRHQIERHVRVSALIESVVGAGAPARRPAGRRADAASTRPRRRARAMGRSLEDCFEANRSWAARMRERDPEFFETLRDQQHPELLWIGCSDSRLPPDRIIAKQPGEVFVHRNVGNVVVATDMNCLSVLQYGVEVLAVRHVVVCGHYGCGGVRASLQARSFGAVDNWLGHIRDVQLMHRAELQGIADFEQRADRLCELNVVAQVANVCRTSIVQDAWRRGRPLAVHGWIYSVSDGLLRDLDATVERPEQIPERYRLP